MVVAHHGWFRLKIFLAVLEDAESINPQVVDSEIYVVVLTCLLRLESAYEAVAKVVGKSDTSSLLKVSGRSQCDSQSDCEI